MFVSIDGIETKVAPRALLGISGGPTADFNMALVDTEDDAVLREFAEVLRKVALPAVFFLSSACAARLGPVAAEIGFVNQGNAPLMALTGAATVRAAPGFSVDRVQDTTTLALVADLVAASFEVDRSWVDRAFCAPALLNAPAFTFFLASKDGEPYSALTTSTGGAVVGIWSMATPENRRRQGAAKAALLCSIEHHRRLGATTFYLIASAAGKPLYDSVGFKTVEEFPIWVFQPTAR